MTPIFVHPTILRHPGRIERLEQRTGMRVVRGLRHPQLVYALRPRPAPEQPGPEAA